MEDIDKVVQIVRARADMRVVEERDYITNTKPSIRREVVTNLVQFLRVCDFLADCCHFLIQPESGFGAVCQPFL